MSQNKPNKHCSQQDRTHPNASEPTYQGWVVQGQQKASLQKKIFGLSIFLFALELWRAVMKNDDRDSNHHITTHNYPLIPISTHLARGEQGIALPQAPPLSRAGVWGGI
jgi:hypothetical protein